MIFFFREVILDRRVRFWSLRNGQEFHSVGSKTAFVDGSSVISKVFKKAVLTLIKKISQKTLTVK